MYFEARDNFALPGLYGKETMRECTAKNPELEFGQKQGRKGSKSGGGKTRSGLRRSVSRCGQRKCYGTEKEEQYWRVGEHETR